MEKSPLTCRASGLLNIVLHISDMMASLNRAADAFLNSAVDGVRWAMLVAPVLLAFANPVHAESNFIVTDDAEYVTSDVDEQALFIPQITEIRTFGPFRIVSADRAELIDGTDSDTPHRFRAMLAAYPGLRQIDMIECPGSEDDDANLALARMIRAAGLTTHVPAKGSIRSGGVELFLAGTRRIVERGAEIGVHSWKDSDGLEATDYPKDDPVHTPYIRFYRDMGMLPETARAFYDFTNEAAAFDDIHDMTRSELERFGLLTG